MSESKPSPSRDGIGFFEGLTLLFIGLKLTGHIDWSWWWVLSPLVGYVVSLLLVAGLSIVLISAIKGATK